MANKGLEKQFSGKKAKLGSQVFCEHLLFTRHYALAHTDVEVALQSGEGLEGEQSNCTKKTQIV